MNPSECVDRIRFVLSDRTGVLRVEDFDIVDAPQCSALAEALKTHLVGRPVAEIDLDHIRSLRCSGDAACMRAIVDAIVEYHEMFAH
ncbi:MAG: hypothetical protein JRG91_19865 [Deltaproteobacteria bacterium]|nr:hypothetical protein [Deltaproteobacteria bacterium]